MRKYLAWLLVFFCVEGSSAEGFVLAVLSGPEDYYRSAYEGFRSCFQGSVHETVLPRVEVDAFMKKAVADKQPDILFTVGGIASQVAMSSVPEVPAVYAMVMDPAARNYTMPGVAMDLKAADQIAAIRSYFPEFKTIGVLYGPNQSKKTVEAFRAAKETKVILKSVPSLAELLPAMTDIAREADCLLMLPDPDIYPPSFAAQIILHALQENLPLIAPSPAYVRAGALAGLYTSPVDSGCQAGRLAARLLAEGRPKGAPVPEYASRVKLAVNTVVAGRLNISIPDRLIKEADFVVK